ncbi:hypothetical protein [Paeniglutamicibacter cryotolerans]|uniref:Permease n=1 Tax=Paeniglutamicibacter cryotolerans TaxID=670079 RepID=A0A839QNE3_9MICC|nr:hypothetical protein [Paeniglutamicibacter cryotolerans]MBB2996294.1 hypothetical protein [Paeniglutamicibacter cryotolerans]
MSESPTAGPEKVVVTTETLPTPRWGLRIGLGIAGVAVAVATYVILPTFLQTWWATTIKSQANGDLGTGLLLGLFYGFVFTFVPLLLLWQARHRKISWPWKAVILGAAVLLATPNLLTLGIYASNSASALKARNMIDNDATWFPGWSLGAAIAAAMMFIAAAIAWEVWRSRGKKLKELKQARNLVDHADRRNSEKPVSGSPAATAPTTPVAAGDAQAESGNDSPLSWLPEENDGSSAR